MNDYTMILGGREPLIIGERYTGVDVDIDGQLYPDQSFVVLRQGALTEISGWIMESMAVALSSDFGYKVWKLFHRWSKPLGSV
jgi:hypothetical protein